MTLEPEIHGLEFTQSVMSAVRFRRAVELVFRYSEQISMRVDSLATKHTF